MRFYTHQHKFYCGIDLHARTMYLCNLDQEGKVLQHRDIKTDPAILLKTIAPYREDIVVAVECIFTLETAEEEARKRGAKNVYLDTFSFQAPDFYKQHGYRVFGELKDFPPGHQRYFFTKQL